MSSPLCGKSGSIRTYDPDSFEDDVELIAFTGLGYARGFSKEVVGSIDDDPELKARLLKRVKEVLVFLES